MSVNIAIPYSSLDTSALAAPRSGAIPGIFFYAAHTDSIHHFKSQVLLKGVKVAIVVEQPHVIRNDKGSNETVNGFADSDSPATEGTVIFSTLHCNCHSTYSVNGEGEQGIFCAFEIVLLSKTL